MTKAEYGEVALAWGTALRGLRDVEDYFVELAFELVSEYEVPTSNADISDALDEAGAWITGSEYDQLRHAIALMETVTGRAFERSL
jgi:hypothetical protein